MLAPFSVIKTIIAGLVGLVFTTLVFLFPHVIKNSGKSPFHEIKLNTKSVFEALLQQRITILSKKIDTLNVIIKNYGCVSPITDDSAKCKKNYVVLEALNKLLKQTKDEKQRLAITGSDSLSSFSSAKLYFNQQELNKSLSEKNLRTIRVLCIDTFSLTDANYLNTTVQLKVETATSSFDFLGKYPSYGLLLVVSIIQSVLWWMVIYFMLMQTGVLGTNGNIGIKEILKYSLLPLVAIILFTCLLYWVIIDRDSISNNYFLSRFNSRIFIYAIPGYAAAVVCFSAYLYISDQIETNFKSGNLIVMADFENKLKSTFILSVIILSCFVFWVGLLINAINTMDAMKIYSGVFREPFIKYDFVYLIGLLHSLILFMFYIPAELSFNTFQAKTAANSNSWWKKIFSNFSMILVPAAPFLTGLIQGLIESFLN